MLVAMALFLVVSTALAHAQAGGTLAGGKLGTAGELRTSYDLSWFTIDGGGGTVSGEGYALAGIAGQPEPGAALRGGGYTLVGGFWEGAMTENRIYLPLVLRNCQ
jgi:hypothetical protein